MTRAELIAALQGGCGHCGHRWLQHPAVTSMPPIMIDKSERPHLVVGHMAAHRDDLSTGLCTQCACPARYGFTPKGLFFVIVPCVFPCCGEEGALVTTEADEIAGAPWRTACAKCGAGLAVSKLVDVAVLQ